MAMEKGRNLTEKNRYEQVTKTDFRFLGRKKDRTVDCDAIYFCVFFVCL